MKKPGNKISTEEAQKVMFHLFLNILLKKPTFKILIL